MQCYESKALVPYLPCGARYVTMPYLTLRVYCVQCFNSLLFCIMGCNSLAVMLLTDGLICNLCIMWCKGVFALYPRLVRALSVAMQLLAALDLLPAELWPVTGYEERLAAVSVPFHCWVLRALVFALALLSLLPLLCIHLLGCPCCSICNAGSA